jgi:holo-ACP synthase
MLYSADDILLEREQRVEYIQKLLQEYNCPVVFVRVNYPGLNKINPVTEDITQLVTEELLDKFKDKIKLQLFRTSAEGPTLTLVLDEGALQVKRTSIKIEDENRLGRYADIDVYEPITFQGISRKDLGIDARKCYLCEEAAHNCVRSRKHSQDEVIKFIHNAHKEYMRSRR